MIIFCIIIYIYSIGPLEISCDLFAILIKSAALHIYLYICFPFNVAMNQSLRQLQSRIMIIHSVAGWQVQYLRWKVDVRTRKFVSPEQDALYINGQCWQQQRFEIKASKFYLHAFLILLEPTLLSRNLNFTKVQRTDATLSLHSHRHVHLQ